MEYRARFLPLGDLLLGYGCSRYRAGSFARSVAFIGWGIAIGIGKGVAAGVIPVEEPLGTQECVLQGFPCTATLSVGITSDPLVLDLEPFLAIQMTGTMAEHVTE